MSARMGCFLAVFLAACRPEIASGDPLAAADTAEIARLREAFVQAELAGEWAQEAALFAEDGALLEPDASLAEGRQAIRAGLAEFDVVLDDLSFASAEVTGHGQVAFDRGSYAA